MLHQVPAAIQVVDAALLAGSAKETCGGADAVIVGTGASIIVATLRLAVRMVGVCGAGMLSHGLDLIHGRGLVHGLVALTGCCGCVVPVVFPQEDGCGELCLGEHLCEGAAAEASMGVAAGAGAVTAGAAGDADA